MSENTDGKHGGQFKPGQSGNPSGRPPGARNKVTRAIEELMEGEHIELARAAIDKAKAGDMVALRLCLERLCPPRRDCHVSFELPPIRTAAEAVEASSHVLAAVAGGTITPEEGGRVMTMLTAHKSLVEVGDLEARIVALEQRATQ